MTIIANAPDQAPALAPPRQRPNAAAEARRHYLTGTPGRMRPRRPRQPPVVWRSP